MSIVKIKYLNTVDPNFTQNQVYDVVECGGAPMVVDDNGRLSEVPNFQNPAVWETVYAAVLELKQLIP